MLKQLGEVLLALLQAGSTLYCKIALHLPRDTSLDSKTRVVARTLYVAGLTSQDVQGVLLPLIPGGMLTLVMDLTTWHYEQTLLNLME